MSISKYRPQRRNANKHTQRGLRMLEDSIQRDGWIGGITVAADGETFDGSARLETLANVMPDAEPIVVETNGQTPVIIKRTDIPNADDPRAKRLAIVANHSAAVDLDWDAAILSEIAADDAIVAAIAQEDAKLRELLKGEQKGETTDAGELVDKAAQLQEKWQTELGQMWQLGAHRLIIGDSTSKEVVDALMQGERAALLAADPPYNVGKDYGEQVDDQKAALEYETFTRLWFGNWQAVSERQITTPGCYNLASWARFFEPYHIAPWIKTNSMTNGKVARWWCWEPVFFFGDKWNRKRPNDVFDYPIGQQKEVANHPCPKPLKMWADIIESYTEPGDIVADAFGGTGTTLIACEQTGRKARLCEIEPKYAAIILERYQTVTGLAPTRAGG